MVFAGSRLRSLASRLDLVRSTGVRHALRRRGDAAMRARFEAGRAVVYRRLWQDAADELGAELRDLGAGILELSDGSVRTRVRANQTQLADPVSARLALDKPLVSRLLAARGLPVPESLVLDGGGSFARAGAFLDASPSACAVRPANGDPGATAGIETRAQLRRAIRRASATGAQVLVERELEGHLYRLLFLDAELLDVIRRDPPTVTGNGRSTIEELTFAENARRIEQAESAVLELLTVNLEAVFTLERAGLRLHSILPAGETVAVKRARRQNRPAESRTIRSELSGELVAEAREAAELVGPRLVSVDVIAADLTQPLRACGGAIVDVDAAPGLHQHYQVADALAATHVCVPILRAALHAEAHDLV